MSILSWVGQKISLTTGGFWTHYFGVDSWAGKTVTLKSMLEVSAAFACIRLNAQTVGTLSCGVVLDAGGREVPASDHHVNYLVHDMPNVDFTASDFWEGVTAGVLSWGNGYGRKAYLGTRLVSIGLLDSARMVVTRDRETGRLRYNYQWPDGRAPEVIPQEEIFHVRGFGFGADVGLSPIGLARQTLGTAMAAQEAAARTFSNGMRPGGFFLFDHELTPKQREEARENLINPMSGASNHKKIGLLELGVKWQDVSMAPDDAELLLSRRFDVEEVCRWFGTPPILVGHASEGQTMWGTGIEQIVLGWVKLGLRPLLKRIEMAAKRDLFTAEDRAKGFGIKFNLEALLRGDSAARAALISVYAQNGVKTRNELRAWDNDEPLPGGDILTAQSNLVPLERLGETPARRASDGVVQR